VIWCFKSFPIGEAFTLLFYSKNKYDLEKNTTFEGLVMINKKFRKISTKLWN